MKLFGIVNSLYNSENRTSLVFYFYFRKYGTWGGEILAISMFKMGFQKSAKKGGKKGWIGSHSSRSTAKSTRKNNLKKSYCNINRTIIEYRHNKQMDRW